MPPRWRLSPDADLRWRFWDGECVFFDVRSSDTHLLDALSGEVLLHLKNPATESELRERLDWLVGDVGDRAGNDRLRATLSALSQAKLIETANP